MSETKTVEQELLEALKDLFEQCAMTHKHWGEGCNREAAQLAIERAQAAIKRAEKQAEKSTGELVVEALRKSGVDASWE